MPPIERHHQSKRKRAATSCSECQRRKQKCDRKRPCNHCVARKVSNQCFFDTPSMPSPTGGFYEGLTPPSDRNISDPTTRDPGGAGYSLIAGSNAFVGLEQVLPNEEFQGLGGGAYIQPPSSELRKARGLISKLPPAHIVKELTDVFFAEINWHYDIIERFYFEDLFTQWQTNVTSRVKYLSPVEHSKELQCYPAVLFQVIGLTLQFLPPDAPVLSRLSTNEPAFPQEYSDLGHELLSVLDRQAVTLTAVQADLLRASWLKNCGRGMESWHTLGRAIRHAQELGLHRQKVIRQEDQSSIDETLSLIWYEEHKRRLWINLFVWDGLMAMILGRPRMINADDCDLKPPLDCNIPKDPSRVVPIAVELRDNHHGVTTVSACLFRYALANKFHEMRALKADQPYPKDYSNIQTINDQVVSLLDEVPPFLRPRNPDMSWDSEYPYLRQQREDLLTIHNLILMALHRPHIIANIESRKAALQAALATLDSQERFFEHTERHHYPLFGLAFYTVDASFLISIIAILYPLQNYNSKSRIDHALQRAIQRLSHIEACNPIARSGVGILQCCYKKIKHVYDFPSNPSSGSMPASLETPDSGLQSIRRDVNNQVASLQDFFASEPYPLVNANCDFDLSTPGLQASFDQAYWLQQLDQIQPSLVRPTDADVFWESVVLD